MWFYIVAHFMLRAKYCVKFYSVKVTLFLRQKWQKGLFYKIKYIEANFNFFVDFKIIFITAFVILFPSSNIVYKTFKKLPKRGF